MMTFTTCAGGAEFSHGRTFHGGWIGDLAIRGCSGAHGAEFDGITSGLVFSGRSTNRGSKRGVG